MAGMEEQLKPTQDNEPRNRSLSPSPSPPHTPNLTLTIQDASTIPQKEPTSSSQSPTESTTSSTTDSSASPQSQSPPPQTHQTTQPKMPAEDPSPDTGILETGLAKTESDLIEALHLITDSIAQQRQLAASSILHHPLYWFLLIILFEYLYRLLYYGAEDWIIVLITWSGGVLFSLNTVKLFTGKYLDEAERVGTWSWLFGEKWVSHFGNGRDENESLVWAFWNQVWVRVPSGDIESWLQKRKFLRWSRRGSASSDESDDSVADWERYSGWQTHSHPRESQHGSDDFEEQSMKEGWLRDWIFVSKFKDRVIATLVMRVVPIDTNIVPAPGSREKGVAQGSPRDKAVIRAWTVKPFFRGHGIGKEVLQYAIQVAKERGLEGPVFADDHANSKRLWLGLFNERMNRLDKRAKEMLKREVKSYEDMPMGQTL